nr:reverse transcriptase domain-containing protein [Tanacetum cinerariifolium]
MDDEPMWAADRVVAPTLGSTIIIPETTNKFAIKGNHLILVIRNQSDGRIKTDMHKHIHEFLEICDMFKYKDTKNEAVRLMMFPLSLTGSSSLDTEKTMARMDAMTMKMDAQYKEMQSRSNHLILEYDEDDKPMKTFLHIADAVIRVKQKQLNLGVGTERMTFSIAYAMKHSYSNDDTCFSIDVIDEILKQDFDVILDKRSEILHSIKGTILEEKLFVEFDEFMAMNIKENSESESKTEEPPFKKITFNIDYKIKTSLEQPPSDLEPKPLSDHLEYVFLEEPTFRPDQKLVPFLINVTRDLLEDIVDQQPKLKKSWTQAFTGRQSSKKLIL